MTSRVMAPGARPAIMTRMPRYADDLVPGAEFALGEHTLSEAAIVSFAREWDPAPMHVDPEAGRAAGFGGVIASGLQTLAVYQRLAVPTLWADFASGVGRSFEVRFRRPVPAGTTLTGRAVVESVQPRPERGNAVAVIAAELADEAGQVVLALGVEAVLPLRPAG
jgi:acyl dehydratase